ncbi:MAG TPA: MBL fold metallo-hydrolase [Candidatus Limnocylindrales bacterium]|nr:MBL fold metallo-hydrolase [Candidatus Limnocylindrales bacterium]
MTSDPPRRTPSGPAGSAPGTGVDTAASSAAPVEPVAAATVVLLRPGRAGGAPELLLTHRPMTMAFAADLHVFPGGRVDPGDADPRAIERSSIGPAEAAERLGGDIDPTAAVAAGLAAVRELFEEAGVLLVEPAMTGGTRPDAAVLAGARERLLGGDLTLGELGEELDLRFRTDLLAPIVHWTTPPFMPRRFDTRFFAAELPAGVEASFVGHEVAAHRWLSAADALTAMAAGTIAMWIPTSTTLQQLEHVRSFDEIRTRLAPGPAAAPRVLGERPDVIRIVLPEAGALAGRSVNAYVVGRRDLVVIDPGDPSDAAAEAILGVAAERDGRIVAIALTHADADHAAGAEGLAIRLDAPIFGGPGAGRPLPHDVTELADGEIVPAGDVPLRILVAPGPRPDHVALVIGEEPGGRVGAGRAVLTGDLVGGRGERSVFGPADEAAWAASLDRVAATEPGLLLPGHGEPLGPDALRLKDRSGA